MSKSIIIGTAGHVDHGKTRLIGALTGTNTDRLKEEQQRGISIELGFAQLSLGEVEAGIVDVPGHEKFVRTMVAGAGGFDLALLVVAADEGVMPQTREHVEVLELLGVKHGIVALNKIDMVDEEMIELAAEDVHDYLAGTCLADAEVVPVSAATGAGVDALRDKLKALALALPERGGAGPFRLPIDRVFTLTGKGTVVTGTAWSGSVRVGDQLELMPRGLSVRVRSLQVHERSVEEAHAGQRTALAIHGIKHDELERGEVLVSEGRFAAGNMVTLKIRCLPSCPWVLKHRTRLRFHFGTQEILGRLVLLDREVLRAGEEALGQARLESPAVCAPGDRVIVRFYSPMRTVAGGEVIEATAPKRRHGRDEDLEAVKLKESGDPALILERAVEDFKEFAFRHARAENACTEFDLETLAPLYKLLVGTPGESGALVIARRLGIPDVVVDRARDRIERRDVEVASLMEDVRVARTQAERVRNVAESELDDARAQRRELDEEQAAIERRSEQLEQEAQRGLEERVRDAMRQLERARALLVQIPKKTAEPLAEVLAALEQDLSGASLTERRQAFIATLGKGSLVYLPRYRQRVIVHKIDKARREVVCHLGKMKIKVAYDEVTPYESL